jgi:hypothetical protein
MCPIADQNKPRFSSGKSTRTDRFRLGKIVGINHK